jgi:hypothetical protein
MNQLFLLCFFCILNNTSARLYGIEKPSAFFAKFLKQCVDEEIDRENDSKPMSIEEKIAKHQANLQANITHHVQRIINSLPSPTTPTELDSLKSKEDDLLRQTNFMLNSDLNTDEEKTQLKETFKNHYVTELRKLIDQLDEYKQYDEKVKNSRRITNPVDIDAMLKQRFEYLLIDKQTTPSMKDFIDQLKQDMLNAA